MPDPVYVGLSTHELRRRLQALIALARTVAHTEDADALIKESLQQIREALSAEWAALWVSEVRGRPYAEDGVRRFAETYDRRLMAGDREVGNLAISLSAASLNESDREFIAALADQMAMGLDRTLRQRFAVRRDPLTGLANDVELEEQLTRELARAARYSTHLTLGMLAVEREGDDAVRAVARALAATLRSIDIAARLPGGEFALVFPQTNAVGAQGAFDRILKNIPGIPVTPAMAVWSAGMTAAELRAAGEEALREARQRR
jgi:diguanylate cyclase (GGDEF)-like protein